MNSWGGICVPAFTGEMNQTRPKIFLSSVSSEFREHREALARDIRGPDSLYEVVEQSDFTGGGGSLLEHLNTYIASCSAVVHLIGDLSGMSAKPGEIEAFFDANPDFLKAYPTLRSEIGDGHGISYTQWEAYLALHHGVPCFVFVSDTFEKPGRGIVEEDVVLTDQQRHFARMSFYGKSYTPFSTPDRLTIEVHRTLGQIISSTPFGSMASTSSGTPRWHERFLSEADAHAPLTARLGLPYHLLAGTSMRVEVELIGTGRGADSLEDITMSVHLGTSKEEWSFAHLPQGGGRSATGELVVAEDEVGSRTLRVQIGVRRGALKETYISEAAVEIALDEALKFDPTPGHRLPAHLAANEGTTLVQENRAKGAQFAELPLALTSESMEKRSNSCHMALLPVMASGRTFTMGDPKAELDRLSDETPHPVRFSRGWWIGRFPVSQGQFEDLMGYNPSLFAEASGNLPVEKVTWHDAVEFCERLTEHELAENLLPSGFRYRLPTEAEWEYCCRAGDDLQPYGTGSKASGSATGDRRPSQTLPLDGGRGANRLNICDMLGNVYEWTADSYAPYDTSTTQHDPRRDDEGQKVIRGGCWKDPPSMCRPTVRVACPPDRASGRIGFRVVLARA